MCLVYANKSEKDKSAGKNITCVEKLILLKMVIYVTFRHEKRIYSVKNSLCRKAKTQALKQVTIIYFFFQGWINLKICNWYMIVWVLYWIFSDTLKRNDCFMKDQSATPSDWYLITGMFYSVFFVLTQLLKMIVV